MSPIDETAQGTPSFCRNCGNPLASGVQFCAQCGTPVAREAEPVAAPQPEPIAAPAAAQAQTRTEQMQQELDAQKAQQAAAQAAAQQAAQQQQAQQAPYAQQAAPYSQQAASPNAPKQPIAWGWAILGFFIPIVGLILFLVWRNDPVNANNGLSAGKGALISVIVGVVFSILGTVMTACAAGMLGNM